MNDRSTPVARMVRRGVMVLAVTGVVAIGGAGSGIAQDGGDNGRDPGASPGAAVDAPAPVATNDGRAGGAAPDGAARSAAPAVFTGPLDNGRGGVDPAAGPNPVPAADVARTASAATGIDTDSGAPPVSDAAPSAANEAPSAPVDEDVPGSAGAADADLARGSAPDGPAEPVDRDQG